MSSFNVYVGDLNDPKFCWEGGDWNGNLPKRITHFFPVRGRRAIELGWIKEVCNVIESKQTDWAGWVYKIKGSEVLRLYDECCLHWRLTFNGRPLPYEFEEDRVIIQNLEPEKVYGVVQYELIESD